MNPTKLERRLKGVLLGLIASGGLLLAALSLVLAGRFSSAARAAPIEPPQGYPKLSLSTLAVTPTLVHTGGETLTFTIEIINTGAYTGYGVQVADSIPVSTTYNNDASSSVFPQPVYTDGMVTWMGAVGFDSAVVVSFSVNVLPEYEGIVTDTAVISHGTMAEPLQLWTSAVVSDDPFFEISKSATPAIPGAGKPLTYTLSITNLGQEAISLPVTVTDQLPLSTTFLNAPPDGVYDPGSKTVTWSRPVSMATGATEQFTLAVQVGEVPSGTLIANLDYSVENPLSGLVLGGPYTLTVLDPELFLYKEVDPFPPGSNREMTYSLTLLNKGSLATDLEISDTLPDGVTYLDGGELVGDQVQWSLPSLDTGESVVLTFTVYVGDVAEVPVLNDQYQSCSTEGVCQSGIPLTSIVKGPGLEAAAFLDPIAKKPGGGGGPVTPTLTLKNLGPGNALDASALLYFGRISVSNLDVLVMTPTVGTLSYGPECGENCRAYRWLGDIAAGEAVTFTTIEGQSTIGGEEGTHYTATIVVSDTLGDFSTGPITATAVGTVTHFANLIPYKVAPSVIGAGQLMTYTINVWNSGLSTDAPPQPGLTDSVPASVTLVSVGDGGSYFDQGGQTIVTWTLPSMGPGERVSRAYAVQVNADLVSGTLIVNDDYHTSWTNFVTQTYNLSNTGEPVTTIVKEVGLVDSFKVVTPTWALPGVGNLLTYVVHVANTSPSPLNGVQVFDSLPWQMSTYQRDALVSNGEVFSDIVSIDWSGDVAPLSEALITFTVLVDPGYEGAVTNTAVIRHSSLVTDVVVQAVAYITDDPVLRLTKTASPDPVPFGENLLYTLHLVNLGQQATELSVVDRVPTDTQFVPFSASGNGQLVGDQVVWGFPVLPPGQEQVLAFSVKVGGFPEIINADYWATCAEGITAYGEPVVTRVSTGWRIFLPFIMR